MSQESTYVGMDVSKEQIDVAVRPAGKSWSVSYDGAGVDHLVAQLTDLEPTGVLTESTGGLELPLVAALAAASVPIAVVNPRQVRDFAKSTGQRRRQTGWTRRFWRTLGRRCVQRSGL